MARNWLRWLHYAHCRLRISLRAAAWTFEDSSSATAVLWEPLRLWMGQVHMGLNDLEMWERRHDGGHVEHKIHQLYLKSCSYTRRRWRWKFPEQKQIVDTELLRCHYRWLERLYDEAKATVMARYTYDEHDCLTLTGIHSGMESDP